METSHRIEPGTRRAVLIDYPALTCGCKVGGCGNSYYTFPDGSEITINRPRLEGGLYILEATSEWDGPDDDDCKESEYFRIWKVVEDHDAESDIS